VLPCCCITSPTILGPPALSRIRAGRETVLYANHYGHWASWTFYSGLGEMREGRSGFTWRRSPPSSSWTVEGPVNRDPARQCRGRFGR